MNDTERNGLQERLSEAIEDMKNEAGSSFSLDKINLAELERRTGLSRSKLRTLKEKNFLVKPHASANRKAAKTILTGYTAIIDDLLRKGVTNSVVILERLQKVGYPGGLTTVKTYIAAHKDLVPAKRQLVAPQGSRGRRFTTGPGEAFQMDWGFVKVLDYEGNEYSVACFAMICHHCGERYIEFFPNARQENLFIGMIRAFQYMGVPRYVLTDNMKSVVVCRDIEGHPIWQKDYEAFMAAVGFKTRLCKPRHPFTKGKVERLVRFVKENFLVDRQFWNVTDLNRAALEWCNEQNCVYHKALDLVPQEEHYTACAEVVHSIDAIDASIMFYLCPERRISFDGFVNYEGRRFGVPYNYRQSTVRVMRLDDILYIYSSDLQQLLTTHDITWSRRDRLCPDQYVEQEQPEEFPTMPVKTVISQLPEPDTSLSFSKFDFEWDGDWDE